MKVLAIITSNRENSRSAKAAREMIRGAEAAGHDVKIYDLSRMPMISCQGCKVCRKNNCDCVVEDALKPYFADLHESDAVILAAPNHNSQPAGQMITFMNRHYCMLTADKQPRLDHDVKMISAFAQGAPADHAPYREHYEWFLGCFRTKRLISTECLVIGGDTDLSEGSEMMKRAYEAGYDL